MGTLQFVFASFASIVGKTIKCPLGGRRKANFVARLAMTTTKQQQRKKRLFANSAA